MKEKKIKVIIAGSGFEKSELERRLVFLRSNLSEGYEADLEVLKEGPSFLDSEKDFTTAGSATVRGIAKIEPTSCNVAILAGAIDPGLVEAREVARVPLIGPGETGMFLARVLGKRISIVTVDKYAVKVAAELVKRTRMEAWVVSIRSMDLPVRQIVQNLDQARKVLSEQCLKAVKQDKADVIYLGSMSLGTLGVSEELRLTLGVPIIDPNIASLKVAELVCRFKA